MICPRCGTDNRVGAKFCSECATALAAACPTCGTVNSPAAKFCSECATALVAGAVPRSPGMAGPTQGSAIATVADGASTMAAPVAERRLVTILFADLVGFTAFAEGRDQEEVRDLLSRYFDLAREVVGRYGGTIEKFIGDAVMAVWGAPVAREDDAERAVRAGLELVAAVPGLGPTVQARSGVLTGEAAVTIGATNQGLVAGDIVNTASRLQSVAPPGAVLVGEATQRAAIGSIVFERAGEQTLKGKSSPVPAWRAVRVVAGRGGRNRADALEAPFVGRDEELRQLKELFHATARERRPRLVSVFGPAGIGKHRLAWELLKYLDGLIELVWWHAGRSPAYGEGITFWALGEMVRERAGLSEGDDAATTRERIAAIVREHVPDPEEQRWIEPALLALLGFESSLAADQLFAAWRTFFERLAVSAPVVMVFEDFHHADSGLLDFVDHLMEWSRGVPIMVLTLARPELLERRPDWGAGTRTFAGIHLEPLGPKAMSELLEGLVPGLPARAVSAIVERAEGIPLYAVETVRMLLAQGRLVQQEDAYHPIGELSDLAVPETLTALIAARLDGLEGTDRALVEDASVLGQSFTVAGLEAVSGADRTEIEPRLRSLVRRELLVLDVDPRSPERGQYRFVQALIREVAYNTLARKHRKDRHLAAARYFESLGTDELAAGLASHYLAAQRLAADPAEVEALAAQARIALRGAADRAATLGAHDQAVAFIEQALEVTQDAAERADLHDRALASARQSLVPEVELRHAEGALAERRLVGDRADIARASAALGTAIVNAGSDPRRALAMLTEAWHEFGDLADTPSGVALMAALARACRGLDDFPASLEWIERFLPIAERSGLLPEAVEGMLGKGSAFTSLGRSLEGMVLLRGAYQLALGNDLRELELNARVLLTFMEQWSDPVAGLALAREGLEIGRRVGSRRYGFMMVGNGSICAFSVGEWDWAADLLDEWLALEGTAAQRAEFYIDRAILCSLRGQDARADIEEARKLRIAGGMTDPQWESYEDWARAWAAFAAGDLGTARTRAERAVEQTSYFAPLVWLLAIRSCLWANDAEAARAIIARQGISRFAGSALGADRMVAQAGLAALDGEWARAISGFRDALRVYRGLGLAFAEAAAAVDVATLVPPAQRSAELEEAIGAARATLTRLGARPFIERLSAAGGSAASPETSLKPDGVGEAPRGSPVA